jgi:rubrerythrin
MSALDVMARVEEEELRFFETAGEATTDPGLKELFAILADNQRHHLDDLERVREGIVGGDMDATTLKRTASMVNSLRQMFSPRDVVKGLNDPDAFDRVVKAEDGMIDLLKGMAEAEPEERMRRVLELLAEKEREHLATMENIYEFVETPRTYLAWGEFSNLKSL